MKNRKPHTIDLDQLQKWLTSKETIYAHNGSDKKLTVTMNGTLKVYHNDVVIWQTMQPFQAVEKYNEL